MTDPTIADLRAAAERRGWTLTAYDRRGGWIMLIPPDDGLPIMGHGTNERHALADAIILADVCGRRVTFPEQEVRQA